MNREPTTKIALSLKEEAFAAGGYEYYQLFGRSMAPVLMEKDKLFVKSVPIASLRFGDVIVYEIGGKVVVHRLIKKKQKSDGTWRLWTKGDNVSVLDKPVKEDVVIGRVDRILRDNQEWDLTCSIHQFLNILIGLFSLIDAWAWSLVIRVKTFFCPNLQPKPFLKRRVRLVLALPRSLISHFYKGKTS
jgi:signal peptidase I